MTSNEREQLHRLVKAALDEDIGRGDLTSLACLEPNPIRAVIRAKSSGVLSGTAPALLAFEIVDSANTVRPVKEDGARFEPGEVLFEIDGFNQTVFTTERTALNFLGHLSGIATLTRRFVDAVAGTRCVILDTRKTTPGLRALEKAAVVHGGGQNHRRGLFDMVLIKDNHIASAGSIARAVEQTRSFMQTREFRLQFESRPDGIEVEVEVETPQQVEEAIDAGIWRLLLDNQSIESLAELVYTARRLNPAVKLEASGNVSLETVAAIAATGVDYVSIGSLTHSAPSADLSLKVIG